jgi:hypothetical protein
MLTLEELAEKYEENTQGMLDAMINAVRLYGKEIKPEEYFSAIEEWIISINLYILQVMFAGGEEDFINKITKEFMDYAMFDKMARLYKLVSAKKGKNLIVP